VLARGNGRRRNKFPRKQSPHPGLCRRTGYRQYDQSQKRLELTPWVGLRFDGTNDCLRRDQAPLRFLEHFPVQPCHAATAQIGVAVADLFPRLTFAANGGFQSESAGNLLQWASRFGSFGPTFNTPIFDRGRWETVHLYDVRAQEAALLYRRSVLNALHEVENALAAYGADQQRRGWLDAAVIENRDALSLSRQRYEAGLTNFIDVLDAERTLQQNQISLADSNTAVDTDLVGLYRALGGGWRSTR
jgi:outer membrane protein TolC